MDNETKFGLFDFDFFNSWVSFALAAIALIGALYRFVVKPSMTMYKYVRDRDQKLNQILLELNTNGGSSIKDQLNRIESRQLFSEHISKATMASLGIGCWKSNSDGQFIEASSLFCRITGRTETEILGSTWSTWIHHDDRENVFDEWMRCVEEEIEFSMDYRYVRPDGTIVPCHGSSYPIFNDKKQIIGFLGILTQKN